MTTQSEPSLNPGDVKRPSPPPNLPALSVRAGVTGVLTGFANLVPGISAGAVLLATGVFRDFINAMSDLATLRFTRRSIVFLGVLAAGWGTAVLFGAGVVQALVTNHRWVMYSLFIGLTLGGVPLVWLNREERSQGFWTAAALGLLIMTVLGVMQMSGVIGTGDARASIPLLLVGGMLAAGATVLPGGSGTFVLILMGLYVPILRSVNNVKEALIARELSSLLDHALTLLPFAFGMVVGLVSVSLATKWALSRFPRATYGLLLGLLTGSVVGLFPFQRGIPPKVGDIIKAQPVTAESLSGIDPEDWPVEFFTPSMLEAAVSVILILVALALTITLCRLESKWEARTSYPSA